MHKPLDGDTDGSADFIAPVLRRSLHDELVGRLRDMIIEGRLAAGTRIHEGRIGSALGVSRTPLREALKFLASEGLVDLVPGRGAIVGKLSGRDVRNMIDVLIALETLGGRLACKHASDQQIAAVRRLHDEMMSFYAARDRLEYYKRNQAIHTAMAALGMNDVLAQSHQSIQSRLKRIRFIGNSDETKWEGAVAEHEEMIVALEHRDGDRLAAILALHLERTWERVKDVVN